MDSDRPALTQASSADDVSAEQLVVTVKVISPSIATPLSLVELPASVTIRQLKDRIRLQLPSRMSEATQRLIYRGRMLNRDDHTLLTLFGEELIRSSEQPAIHLILSDYSETSTAPAPARVVRGPSPSPIPSPDSERRLRAGPPQPTAQPGATQSHARFFDSLLQQGSRHGSRRMHVPAATQTGSTQLPGQTSHGTHAGAGVPSQGHHPHASLLQNHWPAGRTPSATPPPHLAQQLAHLQRMNQMTQMSQREAFNRAYMNQQRDRSIPMPGARFPAAQPPGVTTPDGGQRRTSPTPQTHQQTQTHVEALPSGGSRVRITTTETYLTSPAPGGMPGQQGLTDAQVQNMLRTADTREAILTMTNAMQRSASGASMGPQSGRATPNTSSRTPSGGTGNLFSSIAHPNSSHAGVPEVYILNSPQGPRALLLHQNSETYYSPAGRVLTRTPIAPTPTTVFTNAGFLSQGGLVPQHDTTPAEQGQASTTSQYGHQEQGQPPAQDQNLRRRRVQVRQNGRRGAEAVAIRANNNAGLAGRVARIWPHFWLGLRLALFVWWFTSPHSSWSRWLTVIAVAAVIFILNTGILDGYAEHIWGIVCRHMENLIPLAEPNQRMRNANAIPTPRAPEGNGNQAPQAPPDPAQAAARMLAQRRQANANWLMDRVRRLERAGLLFLASIAPGVAERHIANLEAEAERQRREAEAARRAAEEAAATAAAAAAAGGEGGNGEDRAQADGATTQENASSNGQNDGHNGADLHGSAGPAGPAAADLIPA